MWRRPETKQATALTPELKLKNRQSTQLYLNQVSPQPRSVVIWDNSDIVALGMDPITAIGAIAATIQLTQFSWKAIFATTQLLRDLGSQPLRLQQLLADTDKSVSRMVNLNISLQNPCSNLAQRLTPDQLAALENATSDGLKAGESLVSLVKPVLDYQNAPSKRKLLWRVIISKRLESDIEEHLLRIQQIDGMILKELQRSGLEVQLQIADILDQSVIVAEKTLSNGEAALEKLQALDIGLKVESHRNASVTQEIQLLRSETQKIATHTQRAESEVQSLREIAVSQQKETAEQMKILLANESSTTQQQLLQLRDEILPLLLGQQAKLSELAIKEETLRLAEQNKDHLLAQLRKELITHPSILRETCNMQVAQMESGSPFRGLEMPCSCRSHRTTKSATFGFLSVRYQTRDSHSASCQERYMRSTSQRFRLALQLLPFLNKTVELTFGATFFGGGFHIETPLRLFGTVQRSRSYMFQLFDDFPESCNALSRGQPQQDSMWHTREVTFHVYEWDIDQARSQLQQLYRSLVAMERNGVGSLRDRDEYGHTLLHELIILIGILAPVYAELVPEIDCLIYIAEKAGVDADAIANTDRRGRKLTPLEIVRVNEHKLFGEWTVGVATRKIAKMFHRQFKSLGFLGQLSRICYMDFEDYYDALGGKGQAQSPASEQGTLPSDITASLREWLVLEPWLTEYFYDDELSLVLLGRRIDKLKILLPKIKLDSKNLGILPFNALDLACGWPEGLQMLSTAWQDDIYKTVNMMATAGDFESLAVVCEFKVPLFKESADMLIFMASLLRRGTVLLDAFWERRIALTRYAFYHLSAADLARFNMTNERQPLDSQAHAVFSLLKNRGFDVPDYLNPGPPGSVYSYAADVFLGTSVGVRGWNALLSLDIFHDYGFRDIDDCQHDVQGNLPSTPLERILCGMTIKDAMWAPICAWFLRVGALPVFCGAYKTKNILFGIAAALAQYEEEQYLLLHQDKATMALFNYAAALFSPLDTDECECFCSSDGCLPIHYLLRGPRWADRQRCHDHQRFRVWNWMRNSEMPNTEREISLEEAVRLDVFNRLEMTHTCCRGRWSMTPEERVEIWSREEEKKNQLDLIMSTYIKSRDSLSFQGPGCGLTSACECLAEERDWNQIFYRVDNLEYHWTIWWNKASKILPIDMELEAATSQMCLRNRFAGIRARILQNQGYGDMDFTDVIRQHFEEELEMEETIRYHEAREDFVSVDMPIYLEAALLHTCLDHGREPWDWLSVRLAPSDDEASNSKFQECDSDEENET